MSGSSSVPGSPLGSQLKALSLMPNTPAPSSSSRQTSVLSAATVFAPDPHRAPDERPASIFPPHRAVGTRGTLFFSYDLPESGSLTQVERMQTLTIRSPFANFSTEELRYADYLIGKHKSTQMTQPEQTQIQELASSERAAGHPDLGLSVCLVANGTHTNDHRLKGPGVEVVVGVEPNEETWSLPKSLASRYSSILGYVENPLDLRVRLPEEHPEVFTLFVQWLFYGIYTPTTSSIPARDPQINLDAQAWFLGDHLQCIEFKNYAMDRLYAQYISCATPRAITTSDVHYTFRQSARESKLHLLYKHLLAARLFEREMVEGTPLQWDGVLQEHTQLRMFVMEKAMDKGSETQRLIQSHQYYKEVKKAEPKENVPQTTGGNVTPIKRNGDGEMVKSELVNTRSSSLQNDSQEVEAEEM